MRLGDRLFLGVLFVTISFCARSAAAAQELTLREAISRALAIAPAIGAAVAQSDLGYATAEEAHAPFFPYVTANGEYQQTPGYSIPVTNGGLTLAQLALNYTVFDGGRIDSRYRAALYAAQAAQIGVQAARAQIAFDTSVAYFDLARWQAIETEAQLNLERFGKYLAVIKALHLSGRAVENDVLKLESTRDTAQLSVASDRQAVEHASIVLASLIGDTLSASPLRVAEINSLPPPTSEDIAESPLIKAAARQVQSAKLAVNAARAERVPTLTLGLTSGWEGINPPSTFSQHLGASYDGTVSVPIFQGGLVRSHIDIAEAQEKAAIAQQRLAENQARQQLADAQQRYQNALRQLAILDASQKTANDAFALYWTRFLGGGNVSLLEVIDAYNTAESLRVQRFDQQFNARQATAETQLLFGIVP